MTVPVEYHRSLGRLIFRYECTLEWFVVDGLLVVMNDPVPCPDHPARTVRMALDMRVCMGGLSEEWRRRGHELGFGIGIAQGYATLGQIGCEGRLDYSVIGNIPNIASRLCGEAASGQILVSQRVYSSIQGHAEANLVGEFSLKGLRRPIPAYEVIRWQGAPLGGAGDIDAEAGP